MTDMQTDIHDTAALVSKALRKAWRLGQDYWQYANSEYQSHWKKADATQDALDRLVEDTAVIMSSNSGAQNVASSQDEWKRLANDLLREIERQTCTHEETHRGGFLWEICDSCGAKWADDEGGKPEFKWSKAVERAHAMLAAQEDKP